MIKIKLVLGLVLLFGILSDVAESRGRHHREPSYEEYSDEDYYSDEYDYHPRGGRHGHMQGRGFMKQAIANAATGTMDAVAKGVWKAVQNNYDVNKLADNGLALASGYRDKALDKVLSYVTGDNTK